LDLQGYRNYRGALVVGAWKWLPNYGFGVGTEMAVNEAYRPLNYVNRAFGFLIGVVVVLTLIVGVASTLVTRLRRQLGQAELLGAYVLGDLIGEGGMGKVYRAWHRALKRTAAVKVLDNRLADKEMIERFKREAFLTCQLTHPSTIQVFDFGVTASGSCYYVMEYLPGYTLQQILAADVLIGVARSLHILLQVCGSLQEAHDHGMAHRDIKPANIMVTERGGIADYVKVLDFGLARPFVDATGVQLTRSQTIVGTPHFIAPESILAPRDTDARSDIYSLGAVAFVMLTGRNVFTETQPMELFRRVVSDSGPPPSSCSSQPIPVELDRLVASCLSVDRAERPSSIAEVTTVMESLAAHFPWTQSQARDWWTYFASKVQNNANPNATIDSPLRTPLTRPTSDPRFD
jgi:serine/threonine protein kinase